MFHTRLLVNSVLPNLLLSSSRVSASTQDRLHLLDTSEQNLSSHEPTDTLTARRASQTALVGPEFVEVQNRSQSEINIHADFLLVLGVSLVEADHGR